MSATRLLALFFWVTAINVYAGDNRHIKRECTHLECTHTTQSSNLPRHVVNAHQGVCGKDGCTIQFKSVDKKKDARDLSAHWKGAHGFLKRGGAGGAGAAAEEEERMKDKSKSRFNAHSAGGVDVLN